MPLFSIITINYNNSEGLQRTIESVISQSFKDYEFIVIDGKSTDNSVLVLEKFKPYFTFCVSEKDKGIYDAQNKGIQKATGNYLIFMNSGDCFSENDILQKTALFINENKHYKIYYGNVNLLEKNGIETTHYPPPNLDIDYLYFNSLNHQSCFIDKKLFEKYGDYNLNYKICADYDFFLKILVKENNAYCYFNETICKYENFGLSKNSSVFDDLVNERKLIKVSLLSAKKLSDLKLIEINLAGRKSRAFNYVPNINIIKNLYDKLYVYWYHWRVS